ncbi:3'-5' exonuclease [Emydomyces testavorans]|uniref:RNA exonuclease 4 n=1 Tax=Emydomyces testavorans TaxID=2070801 RepID=A0AAF0IKE4_9EURO|nr:3'-5' exonuclease [Emydomyces testavorans]
MDFKDLSGNWKKLRATLKKNIFSAFAKHSPDDGVRQDGGNRRKRSPPLHHVHAKQVFEKREPPSKKRKLSSPITTDVADGIETFAVDIGGKPSPRKPNLKDVNRERVNEGHSPTFTLGKFVAIDCEMVGVGPNPDRDSALARVSLVNYNGDQVYDSFVKPKQRVTDWRTPYSGITPAKLKNARTFEVVQADVAGLLHGRILVGHAVNNDLKVLHLHHPRRDTRDTSYHPPYQKLAGGRKPKLKVLASNFLGLNIQGGAHSSVVDARATMLLYQRDRDAFEREHAKRFPACVQHRGNKRGGHGTAKRGKPRKRH